MFSTYTYTLSLIALHLVTIAGGQILENCDWMEGNYGNPIQCAPGYVARGACGSGKHADCKSSLMPGDKVIEKLKCCETKYHNDPVSDLKSDQCQQIDIHDNGVNTLCPNNSNGDEILAVYGICGSGMNHDCKGNDGKGQCAVIHCCDSKDVSVQEGCVWQYGNYGDEIECKSGYLMSGYCGSFKTAACADEKAYTGVYCCPYSDNKKPKPKSNSTIA